MENYLKACNVQRSALRRVATPFIDESRGPTLVGTGPDPAEPDRQQWATNAAAGPVGGFSSDGSRTYDEHSTDSASGSSPVRTTARLTDKKKFVVKKTSRATLTASGKPSKKSTKATLTSSDKNKVIKNQKLKNKSSDDERQLNVTAASIIMTTMYAARMAKPELCRCIGIMTTQLTRWTPYEDKKLHRSMSYLNERSEDVLTGFIADPPELLRLGLFADSDFAGDRADFKSTSGVFLALIGPQTFFPLGWASRKQTIASHSSVEAEIVALSSALRHEGVPALDLWEKILGRTPEVTVYEDNQAAATIVKTGKYPELRHVQRLHGVSISWLHTF